MRRTETYAIYAISGSLIWFLFGNLILAVSVPSFSQFLIDGLIKITPGKNYFVQYLILITCLFFLGAFTALLQILLMAKGGRESSPFLMISAPFLLGAVIGGLLAFLGPQYVEALLVGMTYVASDVIVRLIVGIILGVVAIFATTALATYLRSRYGMRGPL
jgi:hypothetical protein